MKFNNKGAALLAFASTAILSLNTVFLHNKFAGFLGIIFYFLSLSWQMNKIFSKKHPLSMIWAFFTLLSGLIITLTGIYCVYAINTSVTTIILWLLPIILTVILSGAKNPLALLIKSTDPYTTATLQHAQSTSFVASLLSQFIIKLKTLFVKNNILFLVIILLEFRLFFEIWNKRTLDLMKSPWQALDLNFFLPYIATTALVIFINYTNKNNWIKYLLTSIHLFLSYSIATIIYPLGFGIDGFIHRATETYIQQNGFITPKQPFYLGQYSMVVWLSNISSLSVFYVDTYLVPAMTALFLPGAIAGMMEKTFGIAKKYGYSMVFLVPFLFFINLNLTTPHNLAVLLTIFTLCAVLLCVSEQLNWIVPLIISVACVCIHPLLGMPLLIFNCLIYLAKKLRKNKIAFSAISAFGTLGIIFAVPLLFYIYLFITKHPLPELINPLRKISFFLELLQRPYWHTAKSPLIFELIYYWELLLAPLFVIFGIIFFFINEQKNKLFLLFPLTMAGFWFSAFFLRSWIVFPDIGNFEQGDYPLRLLKISLIWIMPWVMYGAYKLMFLIININSKKIRDCLIALFTIICSFALTISLYLSYPQENPKVHFPGYNVTISDFHAAEWIHNDNKEYNYIVLSNPLIAAAAMTKYGFPKYFETKAGLQSYYSTPSGSKLFEEYTQMWKDFGLEKKHMDEAMNFIGVKKAYFVIPSFWTKFDKIVEGAKKTANSWQSTDNGKIYIFTYTR